MGPVKIEGSVGDSVVIDEVSVEVEVVVDVVSVGGVEEGDVDCVDVVMRSVKGSVGESVVVSTGGGVVETPVVGLSVAKENEPSGFNRKRFHICDLK